MPRLKKRRGFKEIFPKSVNLITMRKILLLVILSVSCYFVSAQDETIYMHYTINPILINPAAAGVNNAHNLNLNVRTAWTGFADAPKTISAFYDGPIGKSFGFGLGVMSETAAQLARVKMQLNFAFKFNVKQFARVSTGFFTEFQRMRVDNDIVNTGLYQPEDNIIEDLLDGKGIFDAGIGVYSTMGENDNTFVGVTLNNLVRNKLDNISTGETSSSPFSFYTFLIGHRFTLYDWKVELEPSFLIRKIRESPTQIDLNLKASFLQDQLVAGLSYRSLGTMGILLGTKLKGFKLFYSYDVSFLQFQQYNTGSHEVTIAFKIKKKDKKGEQ